MMGSAARLFEREIRFYQDIAPGLDVRTPRCYYGATSTEDGRHVLLLEDLAPGASPATSSRDARPNRRSRRSAWSRVCTPRGGSADELAALDWMPLLAGVHPSAEAWWDEMWRRCVERAGGRMPAATLRIGERLGANAMWAMRQLDAGPHTIVHGDYRLDNLFFGGDHAYGDLAVVDWQLSTRGCGVYDLAYFLSGSLAPADRKTHELRLLRAWHDELLARGVRGYTFEDACLRLPAGRHRVPDVRHRDAQRRRIGGPTRAAARRCRAGALRRRRRRAGRRGTAAERVARFAQPVILSEAKNLPRPMRASHPAHGRRTPAHGIGDDRRRSFAGAQDDSVRRPQRPSVSIPYPGGRRVV